MSQANQPTTTGKFLNNRSTRLIQNANKLPIRTTLKLCRKLLLLSYFSFVSKQFTNYFAVATTMENSMGQIVPMTSLALSQSMDSVNTATNEEEVSFFPQIYY